jgi:hypothetical protein
MFEQSLRSPFGGVRRKMSMFSSLVRRANESPKATAIVERAVSLRLGAQRVRNADRSPVMRKL